MGFFLEYQAFGTYLNQGIMIIQQLKAKLYSWCAHGSKYLPSIVFKMLPHNHVTIFYAVTSINYKLQRMRIST